MKNEMINNQEIILSTVANLYWQELVEHFFGEKNQVIRSLNKKLNQLCEDASKGNLFAIAILKNFIKKCPTRERAYTGTQTYRNLSNSLKNMALVRPKRMIKLGVTYDNKLISLFLRQIYRFNLPLSVIKSGVYYGRITQAEAKNEINKILAPMQEIGSQCMRYGKVHQSITAEDFATRSEAFVESNNQFESVLKLNLTDDIYDGVYHHSMLDIQYKHKNIDYEKNVTALVDDDQSTGSTTANEISEQNDLEKGEAALHDMSS